MTPKETPITRIVGYTFERQMVVLDFHEYQNCTFRECDMAYHGYGPVGLHDCHFVDCSWGFHGPAAATVNFMQVMYRQGGAATDLIEQALQGIRRGNIPSSPPRRR